MSAISTASERKQIRYTRSRPNDINHNGTPPITPLDDPLEAEARPLGPYTVLDMETYFVELEYPVELYNGWFVWQQMTDFKERTVVGTLQDMLSIPARKAGFGQIVPDQTECRLDEGNDIMPDAALVSWQRMEEHVIFHGPNKRPLLTKCPELVIESRSPSQFTQTGKVEARKIFQPWNINRLGC